MTPAAADNSVNNHEFLVFYGDFGWQSMTLNAA